MFDRLDIVESAPGYSRAVFVITAVDFSRPSNIYVGMNLLNRKTYHLSDHSLSRTPIGKADEDWLKTAVEAAASRPEDADGSKRPVSVSPEMFQRGQARAQRDALYASATINLVDKARWEKLASLRPGDTLTITHRGQDEEVLFQYVAERGTRYVFVATNRKGTNYKYPLDVINIGLSGLVASLAQSATATPQPEPK